MLKLKRQPTLPPQLQWKHSNEPELLSWAIRARNYNIVIANCMFAFMAAMILAATFFMYSVYEGMEQPWRTLSCMFFFAFILFTISCMTHQKMNFAYRFTDSGVEYCEWKNPSKWPLTILKWLTGITAIIVIALSMTDPGFLIGALIGPGGMALTYILLANSKKYQAIHTQYHHLEFEWKDFTQLAIATNREVVDLKFVKFDERLGRTVKWSLNIFCKKHQKENVANFIKPHLPSKTPFIKTKVNVPLSTD
ncbi:hypothetical protein [Pseudomonas sp. NPDC087614]|uniref:hypothetical protein n=1 Tax=Pseudomonas sp. NPDC087614 TaxID=3364442 RepID=UPI00381E906E